MKKFILMLVMALFTITASSQEKSPMIGSSFQYKLGDEEWTKAVGCNIPIDLYAKSGKVIIHTKVPQIINFKIYKWDEYEVYTTYIGTGKDQDGIGIEFIMTLYFNENKITYLIRYPLINYQYLYTAYLLAN